MKTVSLTLAALVMTGTAWADGVPLKDGRYIGPVMVFTLTPEQKQVINQFRTCHLENFKTMNEYTPYVLRLTPSQSKELKTKVGFAPRVFEAFETYRGFSDAGPHWNLALRFSEDQIEVPLDLLLSDSKAKRSHAEQGWKTTNPCFPELGRK
jgi:hypothetical protein